MASKMGRNFKRNWFWVLLCVIGGFLMIYSNTQGSAGIWIYLGNIILNYTPVEFQPLVQALINILAFIASFGGWTVIAGAILVLLLQIRLGRFVMGIGLTFGLLALIIWIINWIINTTGWVTDPTILAYMAQIYGLFNYASGLGFIGVVIGIIGRYGIGRVRKKILEEEEAEKELEEIEGEQPAVEEDIYVEPSEVEDIDAESTISTPLKNKFCPQCGSILPVYAKFCSECGKNFD